MNILLNAYLDRNFGDDMMVRLVAHQLREHNLYLDAPQKELLIPFRGIENLHDIDEHPQVHMDTTLRVTGSGFIIKDKVGLLYTPQRLIQSRKNFKEGKEISVISCNVGPFVNGIAIKLALQEMKYYRLITTRETFSDKFIKSNLKHEKTYCFPDILFSIPDEWLPTQIGLDECLGISVYRNTPKPVLNYSYYQKMAELADEYVSKTQKKVLLFAFDIEYENDICAAITIKNMCEHQEMVEVIVHDGNGSNILNHFARCKYVIGTRFHSIVLALRIGVDVLPVVYSNKTNNMLDDLGYDKDRLQMNEIHTVNVGHVLERLLSGKQHFALPKETSKLALGHTKTFREVVINDKK